MTSSPTQFYYTTETKLQDLAIRNGQIIFTSDTKTIYLDMKNRRHSYSTIQSFASDEERISMTAPAEGYYFVESTNVLWRYKKTWLQITPSNLNPVLFFGNRTELPLAGVENTLYCTDSAIYTWKQSSYQMVADKTEWETI